MSHMEISKIICLVPSCLTISLFVLSLPNSPIYLNGNYYFLDLLVFSKSFPFFVADMLSQALFIWYISQFLRQQTSARLYLASRSGKLMQQYGSQTRTSSQWTTSKRDRFSCQINTRKPLNQISSWRAKQSRYLNHYYWG